MSSVKGSAVPGPEEMLHQGRELVVKACRGRWDSTYFFCFGREGVFVLVARESQWQRLHTFTQSLDATCSPTTQETGIPALDGSAWVNAGVTPHGVTPYSTKVMIKDLNKLLSLGCVTKAP